MRRLATTLGTLAVGVLMAAAGLLFVAHTLLLAGAVLFGISALFWVIDWRARADRHVYVETPITEKFLQDLFRDRTKIQAEKALEMYIGKWLKISGTLTDIDNNTLSGYKVHIQSQNPSIFLYFSRWEKRRLEILHKGDFITASGKITHINRNFITLERCELLSVGVAPAPMGSTESTGAAKAIT